MLLYPAGTWGYTWWEQRALSQQVTELLPADAGLELDRATVRRPDADPAKEAARVDDSSAPPPPTPTDRLREASLEFQESLESRIGEGIGRLEIPRIGLDVVVIEGAEPGDLRKGPGHWPETPAPGMGGNFVLSGHRTTFGAPYLKLDKLEEGDEIRVLLPYAALSYEVTRKLVVLPDETEVVAQRGIEEISLTTCEPIYSAKQRLIIQAELSDFVLLEKAAPAQESPGA